MLNLLIGALAWQLVTTIIFLATREDEETTMVCGMGLPFVILYIVARVFRKIRKKFRKKGDKRKQVCYNVITVKERN